MLESEIAAYKAAESRWDSAVARCLGRQSVAEWLKRRKVDATGAAAVRGLRGFFLADPEDLSLLVLVDQFAQGDAPGRGKLYRLPHGNDALPNAIAKELRGRILLNAPVTRVAQTRNNVRVTVDSGGLQQLTADYVVIALPASTARQVQFTPVLPDDQWRAITALPYGAATRIVLQFESRFWHKLGRPSAYGSDLPIGAVWDANEQQARAPGMLTLLAGGRASAEIRQILNTGGWPALLRNLWWLGRPSTLLAATSYVWERDSWAKGGYAVFGPRFDPALRACLARPAGRLAFAGEHTSGRWQGYMNGAVESGRRAALEIAVTAGLGLPPGA
jgi:monoamine oxidase